MSCRGHLASRKSAFITRKINTRCRIYCSPEAVDSDYKPYTRYFSLEKGAQLKHLLVAFFNSSSVNISPEKLSASRTWTPSPQGRSSGSVPEAATHLQSQQSRELAAVFCLHFSLSFLYLILLFLCTN